VTQDLHFLAGILYSTQVANRQRAGRGPWPEQKKFPEDREVRFKTPEQAAAQRKRMRDHLAQRRAQMKARKKEVDDG
jgi:hypothetical protein